jgi:cytochrome bd-type quinol oxidase subunit 2
MTSRPHLRLVHGRPPEPGDDEREDDPDSTVDAAFPEDAPARADEAAERAARAARRAAIARQVVAALIGFQLLAALRYLHLYGSMAHEGAVPMPALMVVPASLLLYAAAILLALRRAHGGTRAAFIVAAMGFVVGVPFWGISAGWTWPFELGATLALAGAWVVHGDIRGAAARRA